MYCHYYQASVDIKKTWFFVATFRSFEHLAFDRTLDVPQGIFEFFVPKDHVPEFLSLMNYYHAIGLINNLQQLPNRLKQESEVA